MSDAGLRARRDEWVAECVFDGVASRGLVPDIGTLHLDRGYDSGRIRQQAAA